MPERAVQGGEAAFPLDKHILSYHWDDFEPHLTIYDRAARKVDELPLDRLALAVGGERTCVGRFDEHGYRPCPADRRVGRFETCQACAAPWIPVLDCVFEPQCNGDRCDHPEFCVRRHLVYLASFGNLIKVGMTSASRLRERAIEQGADAVRPIFECRDRREARTLEKETSRRFKIPQEIRISRVARTWTGRPSKEAMQHVHEHYLDRIGRWRQPVEAELTFLDAYPLRTMPRSPPQAARTEGVHRGEVLGVKGRFMIYRDDRTGRSMLLNLSDLPARNVAVLE
ncbi:MAG: DUF2797 domain-containing protein [Methanomassiliicoccus sp.]|nr:DUF2797 domain-containing protein [Methanomassiliicoccus sp.]